MGDGMRTLALVLLFLFFSVSAHAASDCIIESGTEPECHAEIVAIIMTLESEGWICCAKDGICDKEGTHAMIYCDGTKAVIHEEKG